MKTKNKMTLGGKLTLILALVWASVWLILWYGPGHGVSRSGWEEVLGAALFVLAYPIATLSGAFSHTDAGGQPLKEGITYFFLMVPNLFLWGYVASGLIHLLRFIFGKCWHSFHTPATNS